MSISITQSEDREAIRRLLDEEDYGIWKKCPFCEKQFPNFSAWISHLRRDHPDKMEKTPDSPSVQ